MEKYAIIVAGGSGSRMGGPLPKQFVLIHGLPVILHSCKAFLDAVPGIRIIPVIPASYLDDWDAMCRKYGISGLFKAAEGGPQRYHSVKSGLKETGDDESLIAVHDAARPCVSPALIRRVFAEAAISGAAIPVVPVSDSIRERKGIMSRAVNRDSFVLVQTPQCFQSRILKSAYSHSYDPKFTDDATLVESCGHSVRMIDGETDNIKITMSADLVLASHLLTDRQ